MSRRRGWEDELALDELRPGVVPRNWPFAWERPAPDLSDVVAARLPGKGHLLQLWEPLRTKAPSPARCQPYCCYVRTVIFYHRPYIPRGRYLWRSGGRWHWEANPRSFAQFDNIETRLGGGDVVGFDGDLFVVGGGHVCWYRKRWWMRFWARRQQAEARAA